MKGFCAGGLLIALLAGCGGDAHVELASADALQAVAREVENTVNEYHLEVCRYDETREGAVIAAFVERTKTAGQDGSALEGHVADFKAALQKIRSDREVEWSRRAAGLDHVSVLREVANGLQKLAIESLSLGDEMRRYMQNWMDARQRAQTQTAGGGKP